MKCCSSNTSAILALKPFTSADEADGSPFQREASLPTAPHNALSFSLRAAKDGADFRHDCCQAKKQKAVWVHKLACAENTASQRKRACLTHAAASERCSCVLLGILGVAFECSLVLSMYGTLVRYRRTQKIPPLRQRQRKEHNIDRKSPTEARNTIPVTF